jgi:urea transport system permease protein
MTLALSLYLFQNDSGLRGNNGLSGLQNIPGLDAVPQSVISMCVLLGLGCGAWSWLCAVCMGCVGQDSGSVIRAIRDNESRVRFLGYHVESYTSCSCSR